MTLQDHVHIFKRRLDWAEKKFFSFYGDPRLRRYERWYLMEGIISQTWQIWGMFCRSVIIDSCLGTQALGNRVIERAQESWVDESRVVYEVHCAAIKKNPKTITVAINPRNEITWGDVGKLVDVIRVLGPVNAVQLTTGFGGGLTGPRHIQTVRNAAAHINRDNVNEVKKLSAFYFGTSLIHPTDIAIWSHIVTKDPAYISWTSDMRTIADVCTQ